MCLKNSSTSTPRIFASTFVQHKLIYYIHTFACSTSKDEDRCRIFYMTCTVSRDMISYLDMASLCG
jgi:hypothetical protein